jgi:hypothetical protein
LTATKVEYIRTLPPPKAVLRALNAAIDEQPETALPALIAGLKIALERATVRMNDSSTGGDV